MKKLMMKGLLLSVLFAQQLLAGPTISLSNKDGVSFEAEILALDKKETTVRRTSDQRVFVVPLNTLNASTRKLLRKNADLITDVHPDYELDVIIGKRRKKEGFYMSRQTVTCKVNIENSSRELDSPGFKMRVLLIGQDQKDTDSFMILTAQDFKGSPSKNATATFQLNPVTTSYDSDNKGYGNVGGFKYEDYILILTDLDNRLIMTKSLSSEYSKELVNQPGIIKKLMRAKSKTTFRKGLKLPKLAGRSKRR